MAEYGITYWKISISDLFSIWYDKVKTSQQSANLIFYLSIPLFDFKLFYPAVFYVPH